MTKCGRHSRAQSTQSELGRSRLERLGPSHLLTGSLTVHMEYNIPGSGVHM